MHRSSKRGKPLARMDVSERIDYYRDLLVWYQRMIERTNRKIYELSDSREWAVIRILEDPRTSQLGITVQQCTALLKPLFPRIREKGCLKVLETLIKQRLVRRRADEPTRYVLNSRCPKWVDEDPTGCGKMMLIDEGAWHHPELDAVF